MDFVMDREHQLLRKMYREFAENEVNTGNVRETFFLNQMKVRNIVVSSAGRASWVRYSR